MGAHDSGLPWTGGAPETRRRCRKSSRALARVLGNAEILEDSGERRFTPARPAGRGAVPPPP
eukprot:5073053-Alexandrium_andersonii.AAC.1